MIRCQHDESFARSTVLLFLALMLAAQVQSLSVEVPPYFRFVAFDELDTTTQTVTTDVLFYTDDTWNGPDEFGPLESLSWFSVGVDLNVCTNDPDCLAVAEVLPDLGIEEEQWNGPAQRQSLTSLGYVEDQWDCWINHYNDYSWEEMEEFGIAQFFEALGWDIDSWENGGSPPSSEDEFWSGLSAPEQAAAEEICYFEDAWNLISEVAEWDVPIVVLPTPPPTPPPTPSPTPLPSVSPTPPPTVSPTPPPTASPTPPPTPSPTLPPTDEPTPAPTPMPSSSPSLSPVTPIPTFFPSPSPSEAPTATPIPTTVPVLTKSPLSESEEAMLPAAGTYGSCNICGEGSFVTEPNGIVESTEYGSSTCYTLSCFADEGRIPPFGCFLLQLLSQDACGCMALTTSETPSEMPSEMPSEIPSEMPSGDGMTARTKSPFAAASLALIPAPGSYPPCNICGDDSQAMTQLDVELWFPGIGEVTCYTIGCWAEDGNIPTDLCPNAALFVAKPCGCM